MMHEPLADNPGSLLELRSRLALGEPVTDLSRVFGGLHHRMWRLDTALGSYAIKQLSPDTDLADPAVRQHYNAAEGIAEAFGRRGVPAIILRLYPVRSKWLPSPMG